MFLLEKTYDVDELFRNNMHTHSVFSKCSKPEMIFEDMVKSAEDAGLKTLAITDHSDMDDGIDLVKNTEILKKRRDILNSDVNVLIGSELSCYGIDKFVEPYDVDCKVEYRNYSCVHYHLSYWEQPDDRSPAGYAKHMLDVLYSLFKTDRADCIAHPFSPVKMKFFNDDEKRQVLRKISDNKLGDVMLAGEKAQCAWEIHRASFLLFPEFYRRFYNIGKEVGVHFNLGTDAHHLNQISPYDFYDDFIRIIK